MDEELKRKIDRIGRINVARKLGWPYNTLSQKCNGYLALVPGNLEEIEAAISELEAEKIA